MSLLPLTSSTLSTLSQSTAHPDSASKLISSSTNPRQILDALVSVLEIDDTERWSSKDRIKALVTLSNFAKLDSLRSDILRSFRRTSASFEALLTSKEQANKDFGGKKVSTEHQLVVVLLFRCVDYRLGADDLLDLLSNNVDVCLALIETLLKSSYEIELVIGVVRLLGEFCHPSTYFKSDESNEEKQNKEAKENSGSKSSTTLESNQDRSCIEFTQRVDKLIQHLMGASLLSSLAAAVQLRINKLARSKDPKEQDVVHVSTLVRHSVVFLLNSYTFLSVNPATFRQHLVVGVNFPISVIVPFLSNVAIPVFERIKIKTNATASLVRTTQACLQLLSIVYFRLNGNPSANEHILQNMHLTTNIMTLLMTSTVHHPKLIGLMILFHSNVDSLGPIHTTLSLENDSWSKNNFPDQLYLVFEKVLIQYRENDIQRGRLIRMLENPEPIPVARDTETLQKLCALVEKMDEGEEEEDQEEEDDQIEVVSGVHENENEKDENDTVALEGKESKNEEISSQKKSKKNKPQQPGFGSSNRRFRLLGALPSFNSHKDKEEIEAEKLQKKLRKQEKRRKKKTKRRSLQNTNEQDCPSQFRCSIDGCLMKTPMKTPGGLLFEKNTIEQWLKRCGKVCPVTGEKLTLEDLTFDQIMATNIQRYMVGKVMKKKEAEYESKTMDVPVVSSETNGNVDGKDNSWSDVGFANDDDLYVF